MIRVREMNNEYETDTSTDEEDESGDCYDDGINFERTPLLAAIKSREKLSVIKKYWHKHHIFAVDHAKNSCLHHAVAVYTYDLSLIKLLLKNRAKINFQNWKGNTPLHSAAENIRCTAALIKLLLEKGADPNIQNVLQETPLHIAIRRCREECNMVSNPEIIKLLLQGGANPNIRNCSYITPIQMAIHPPFCSCSGIVVNELIHHGANIMVVNCFKESLLHKAVQRFSGCSIDITKTLLTLKPSFVHLVNNNGRTPLFAAVFGGAHLDVIKELIKHGADVNARDFELNSPLHQPGMSNYSTILTLVKHGARLDAKNKRLNTPLLECINTRTCPVNPSAIRTFLELGAHVDTTDSYGRTPLYHAMNNISITPEVVKLFLEHGANTLRTNIYTPPVFYCANSIPVSKLFMQFLILRLLGDRICVRKPDKIIDLKLYGPALSNVLTKFRDICISEMLQMKRDRLSCCRSFYHYVFDNNCLGHLSLYTYPLLVIREVLLRLNGVEYANCKDVIYTSLKRDKLIEYLSLLIVHTVHAGNSDNSESIILDFYSVAHVAKFLDKASLLKFIIAYSDLGASKCKTLSSSALKSVGTKRTLKLNNSGTKRKRHT